MKDFNELEKELFQRLLKKYPQFEDHADFLIISKRKLHMKGMLIEFVYAPNNLKFDNLNALFNSNEKIELPALKEGLSYVFDITNGQIETLELSSYNDEKWDGKFEGFNIISLEIE